MHKYKIVKRESSTFTRKKGEYIQLLLLNYSSLQRTDRDFQYTNSQE